MDPDGSWRIMMGHDGWWWTFRKPYHYQGDIKKIKHITSTKNDLIIDLYNGINSSTVVLNIRGFHPKAEEIRWENILWRFTCVLRKGLSIQQASPFKRFYWDRIVKELLNHICKHIINVIANGIVIKNLMKMRHESQ